MADKKPLTIYISEKLDRLLRANAKEQHRSLSGTVSMIIEIYLSGRYAEEMEDLEESDI